MGLVTAYRSASRVIPYRGTAKVNAYRSVPTATDYGVAFDQRTINTNGGTVTGSFQQIAGQWWTGPDDNANVGHVDGIGAAAKFNLTNGMCIGADGYVYASEFGYETNVIDFPDADGGHCIRRINRSTGAVTTFAGQPGVAGYANGPAATAKFNMLVALFPTTTGILICDYGSDFPGYEGGNARLRFCTYAGEVSTVAFTGDTVNTNGTAATASFNGPNGVTMDSVGNIYVCGYGATVLGRVCKIANDANRTVTTLASGLSYTANLCLSENEATLYVPRFSAGVISSINLGTLAVSTLSSDCGGNVNGVAKGDDCIYIVNAGPGAGLDVVTRVSLTTGTSTNVCGVTRDIYTDPENPEAWDPAIHFHGLSCLAFDGTSLYIGESWGCRVTNIVLTADVSSGIITEQGGNLVTEQGAPLIPEQ